jgi:hypothetical protein
MKAYTSARLTALLFGSSILIGCGTSGTPTSPAVPNTAALSGNWVLAGTTRFASNPYLTAAVIVSGSEIAAEGEFTVPCSNAPGSSVGGSFTLTGQIASDGTFQLSEFSFPGAPNASSIQLSINGSAPSGATTNWTGTYSFTDLAGYTSCIVNLTAPFTATALAPINATYAGTLTAAPGSTTLGSVAVSTTIAQGAGTSLPGPLGIVDFYLPLSGTITVAGSPCFTRGTSNVSSINQIEGDFAILDFTMDDGSQVLLSGFVAIPGEASFPTAILLVSGGNCNQNDYFGTLNRQ